MILLAAMLINSEDIRLQKLYQKLPCGSYDFMVKGRKVILSLPYTRLSYPEKNRESE